MRPVPTYEGLSNLRRELRQLAGHHPSQHDQQTFKRTDAALELLGMLTQPTPARDEIKEMRWYYLEMGLCQGKTVDEACEAAAMALKGTSSELGISGLRQMYYHECDSRKPRWWWLPENTPR
jgi:hypothetical protein